MTSVDGAKNNPPWGEDLGWSVPCKPHAIIGQKNEPTKGQIPEFFLRIAERMEVIYYPDHNVAPPFTTMLKAQLLAKNVGIRKINVKLNFR